LRNITSFDQLEGTSGKTSASSAGGMEFNLPHVDNYSLSLQSWCVSSGTKPRRWAPLTRDTRKGIKRVK